MTENLRSALSQLNGYLAEFAESGYSENSAENILALFEADDGSPFGRVLKCFGCSSFEAGALALGILASSSVEAAKNVEKLCGARHGAVTPSLVGAVFFGLGDILPFVDSIQAYSPLGRLFSGVAPRCDAAMLIKESVLDYLLCGTLFDESFLPRAELDRELVELASQRLAEKNIISYLEKSNPAQPFVLQLAGEQGSGRRTCAARAVSQTGRSFIPLCLSGEMTDEDITELSVKLLLSDCVPVVSADGSSERFCAQLRRLADETGFVIAVTERSLSDRLAGTDTAVIRLSPPAMRESYQLWQSLSSSHNIADGVDFAELAGEFEMTAGAIEKALRSAYVLSDGGTLDSTDIKNGCYRSFDADMGDKAVRIDPVFSWDDIVLPAQSERLLRDACEQVRLSHRVFDGWGFARKMPYGRGVSMIFTGPPGTGKTMAAQIVAAELGMEIYKISLANVVSKYIGETEKNLNDIFNKAKLCQCILFFDEADVLFSKRTEVREANDKYSNMESAFLLQKIEEYNGVVILATNLVQNFDEAFKRRMRFIVDFPFPDAARRREMWQKAFPAQAPTGYIDYDFLVERFELSSSNIRNIALHSAFLAAAEDGSIGMKHVMEAIRNEYAKSGKAFTKAEAGEYFSELE